MSKSWWRSLAQRLAYPRSWPTCFAFWQPLGDEQFPPRLGISINGKIAWYRIETSTERRALQVELGIAA